MFKFELDQLIYYIDNNFIHSAPVLSRKYVDNLHENFDSTDEQKRMFNMFGKSRIYYKTCHGVFQENHCAASAEELMNQTLNKYKMLLEDH